MIINFNIFFNVSVSLVLLPEELVLHRRRSRDAFSFNEQQSSGNEFYLFLLHNVKGKLSKRCDTFIGTGYMLLMSLDKGKL